MSADVLFSKLLFLLVGNNFTPKKGGLYPVSQKIKMAFHNSGKTKQAFHDTQKRKEDISLHIHSTALFYNNEYNFAVIPLLFSKKKKIFFLKRDQRMAFLGFAVTIT